MRHNQPFPNVRYMDMLDVVTSFDQRDNDGDVIAPFGVLYRLWNDGGLDEYSDDHFLIRAINGDVAYFVKFFSGHYIQMTAASAQYNSPDSFPDNFVVNFENPLRALVTAFGYDKIRRFVTDQLSAGKEQYNEEMFFEALSEIHILSFFCVYGYMLESGKEPPVGIVSYEYEPQLNGKTNPEARFTYEDGTILDVEIKTPNFSDNVNINQPCLMPGVLLDRDGRSMVKEQCEQSGIQCLLPNVSKMKDYLNSAAKKFQEPDSDKHINLLCVNWTGAVIDQNDITEPLIILANTTNGVFVNSGVAEKCQISKEALHKVSAVLLYKLELGALIFSDFRFIFANRKARVVLNNESNYLNVDAIHRITKLSCIYPEKSGVSSLIYMDDYCRNKSVEEISKAEKVVKDHMLT